jgi:hypothetical protein
MPGNPGQPAAKRGDRVLAIDTHIVMVPSPAGPIPTPMPMPFCGVIADGTSPDVIIDEQPSAIDGTKATNAPAHMPTGGSFQKAPSNEARLQASSKTVIVNDKGAGRANDQAMTCNDPTDAPNGTVIAVGTVFIGD